MIFKSASRFTASGTGKFRILQAAAQNVHPITGGIPEIRLAQVTLVEFRFVKFHALEIRQLHLAFGKHGADNFVAVRKVEAVKVHFGEGVIFQTALFQRVDRVREGTVGHQRCPLDFLQTAVLKIQRLHRRMGAAQTCDLTPHEFALVQRGMIQFAFW